MKSTLCIILLVIFGFLLSAFAQQPGKTPLPVPVVPTVKQTRFHCPETATFRVVLDSIGEWKGTTGPLTGHQTNAYVNDNAMYCEYGHNFLKITELLTRFIPEGATCLAKKGVSIQPSSKWYFECTYPQTNTPPSVGINP
jgi:hypothetical protein